MFPRGHIRRHEAVVPLVHGAACSIVGVMSLVAYRSHIGLVPEEIAVTVDTLHIAGVHIAAYKFGVLEDMFEIHTPVGIVGDVGTSRGGHSPCGEHKHIF